MFLLKIFGGINFLHLSMQIGPFIYKMQSFLHCTASINGQKFTCLKAKKICFLGVHMAT